MRHHEAGTKVPGGFYFNRASWELVTVSGKEGPLPAQLSWALGVGGALGVGRWPLGVSRAENTLYWPAMVPTGLRVRV